MAGKTAAPLFQRLKTKNCLTRSGVPAWAFKPDTSFYNLVQLQGPSLFDVESVNLLVRVLDLIGTFVFALSGAMRGVHHRMDVFGIFVLAFVTAVFGGITRDVLIGAVPPSAFTDWIPLALSIAAGILVFKYHPQFERMKHPVQLFDAAGLAVFAVVGTQKALEYGVGGPMAAVLGMTSGIGGGMVRDVLTARIPAVLLSEIYAVAALAAGLVVVAGMALDVSPVVVTLGGAALCIFLRVMAIYRGWRLPNAQGK